MCFKLIIFLKTKTKNLELSFIITRAKHNPIFFNFLKNRNLKRFSCQITEANACGNADFFGSVHTRILAYGKTFVDQLYSSEKVHYSSTTI